MLSCLAYRSWAEFNDVYKRNPVCMFKFEITSSGRCCFVMRNLFLSLGCLVCFPSLLSFGYKLLLAHCITSMGLFDCKWCKLVYSGFHPTWINKEKILIWGISMWMNLALILTVCRNVWGSIQDLVLQPKSIDSCLELEHLYWSYKKRWVTFWYTLH